MSSGLHLRDLLRGKLLERINVLKDELAIAREETEMRQLQGGIVELRVAISIVDEQYRALSG